MQAVKAKADEIVRLKAQVEEQRRLAEASIRNIKIKEKPFKVLLLKINQ